MDAWSVDGIKTVDNGYGEYETGWKGKLVNGLPDSIWTFYTNAGKNTEISAVEYFKRNKFIKGHTQYGELIQDYRDMSHISLFPPLPDLGIDQAEYLDFSTSCNGRDTKLFRLEIWGKIRYFYIKKIPLSGSSKSANKN